MPQAALESESSRHVPASSLSCTLLHLDSTSSSLRLQFSHLHSLVFVGDCAYRSHVKAHGVQK